jgi:hypothetical protein
MLPSCLEQRVIDYEHASLGHLELEKCKNQIVQSLHMKNLGRKIRKFIACCDLCQRTKYSTPSADIPGDVCAVDLSGSLPTSRAGVKCVLVCYDLFSKHVNLYPLKAAATKACLNE